jgi:hypothetical protein
VAIFTILAALLIPVRSPATIYTVNRSFGSGSSFAALTGTLEIPQGSYLIMNGAGVANPFTAVNLTLVVNGTPYVVNHVHMDAIFGTGQFLINAGPATLNFNTANADGFNPADLAFSDNLNPTNLFNSYAIGYDYSPGFEVAYTSNGNVDGNVLFPTVFGTAVPEPGVTAILLASLGLRGLLASRRPRAVSR